MIVIVGNSHTIKVLLILLVTFIASTVLNLRTIAWIEEYDPAINATRERKEMPIFLMRIQLEIPSPRSHLWTLSMMAGVRRPRVERKMAPHRLMNSSGSGKAAARATVKVKVYCRHLIKEYTSIYVHKRCLKFL